MTPGITDFHSHLIPGVDDGAQGPAESAAALVQFRADGVTQIITTPHFNGSLTHDASQLAARLDELDAGWELLRAVVAEDAAGSGVPLRVERGAEVALDTPEPDLSDSRIRLAGGNFVLVEYPGLRLPPVNAEIAISFIRRQGYVPVLAHPERYRNLEASLADLARIRDAGAHLQLNAGSIAGDYGKTAAAHARNILARGWADFVCSDHHAIGRPATGRFVRTLSEAGFVEQAELLSVTNPGRLLAGESPLSVPPLELPPPERSLVERIFG
jgi:protein-tyrosine phosphatase